MPDQVRVPRRMAQAWMLDDEGELKPEFTGRLRAGGTAGTDERTAQLDRARAFASVAPDA